MLGSRALVHMHTRTHRLDTIPMQLISAKGPGRCYGKFTWADQDPFTFRAKDRRDLSHNRRHTLESTVTGTTRLRHDRCPPFELMDRHDLSHNRRHTLESAVTGMTRLRHDRCPPFELMDRHDLSHNRRHTLESANFDTPKPTIILKPLQLSAAEELPSQFFQPSSPKPNRVKCPYCPKTEQNYRVNSFSQLNGSFRVEMQRPNHLNLVYCVSLPITVRIHSPI